MEIFVRTGGHWDNSTTREHLVQVTFIGQGPVDLSPVGRQLSTKSTSQGLRGAPEDLPAATELIDISHFHPAIRTGSVRLVPVIGLFRLLKSKLKNSYTQRRQIIRTRTDGTSVSIRHKIYTLAHNDLEDLVFLIQRYRTDVQPLRDQLNLQHRCDFIQAALQAKQPEVPMMMQTLGIPNE
jgi:hypothetical protein